LARLHYDKLYKSAALLNLTRKSLIFNNDITSFDFIFGDNLRYKFDYFIDKGNYWSIGLRSRLDQFEQKVWFDFIADKVPEGNFNVNKVELDYLDLTNQIYVETYFLNHLRFGAGIEHKHTRLKTETILEQREEDENLPFTVLEKSNLFGPYGYLEYDGYDNVYFPGKGFYFRGDMHFYPYGTDTSFDFEPFSIIKGKIGYALRVLPKLRFLVESETGFRLGNSKMSALDFFLGGYGNHYVNNIQAFMGYDFLAQSGNSYIKSLAQLDYRLFPKNHLMLGYNIANIGDDLYEDGKIFDGPDYTGFSLGYGIESFLGPLEVFYSYSPETSESIWFFSLGLWF